MAAAELKFGHTRNSTILNTTNKETNKRKFRTWQSVDFIPPIIENQIHLLNILTYLHNMLLHTWSVCSFHSELSGILLIRSRKHTGVSYDDDDENLINYTVKMKVFWSRDQKIHKRIRTGQEHSFPKQNFCRPVVSSFHATKKCDKRFHSGDTINIKVQLLTDMIDCQRLKGITFRSEGVDEVIICSPKTRCTEPSLDNFWLLSCWFDSTLKRALKFVLVIQETEFPSNDAR